MKLFPTFRFWPKKTPFSEAAIPWDDPKRREQYFRDYLSNSSNWERIGRCLREKNETHKAAVDALEEEIPLLLVLHKGLQASLQQFFTDPESEFVKIDGDTKTKHSKKVATKQKIFGQYVLSIRNYLRTDEHLYAFICALQDDQLIYLLNDPYLTRRIKSKRLQVLESVLSYRVSDPGLPQPSIKQESSAHNSTKTEDSAGVQNKHSCLDMLYKLNDAWIQDPLFVDTVIRRQSQLGITNETLYYAVAFLEVRGSEKCPSAGLPYLRERARPWWAWLLNFIFGLGPAALLERLSCKGNEEYHTAYDSVSKSYREQLEEENQSLAETNQRLVAIISPQGSINSDLAQPPPPTSGAPLSSPSGAPSQFFYTHRDPGSSPYRTPPTSPSQSRLPSSPTRSVN